MNHKKYFNDQFEISLELQWQFVNFTLRKRILNYQFRAFFSSKERSRVNSKQKCWTVTFSTVSWHSLRSSQLSANRTAGSSVHRTTAYPIKIRHRRWKQTEPQKCYISSVQRHRRPPHRCQRPRISAIRPRGGAITRLGGRVANTWRGHCLWPA